MKPIIGFFLLAGVAAMTSCTPQTVGLAPVGPNPLVGPVSAEVGYLEVFSVMDPISEGDSPSYFQHTSYKVYDEAGKQVKHVDNFVGYYMTEPSAVPLAAGKYFVKARGLDWEWMNVPVVIEPGRTTKVHLDENWTPPAGTSREEIVTTPGGHPVGWRGDLLSQGAKG